jgi:dTDP-4-dehydrorhamnose reductase
VVTDEIANPTYAPDLVRAIELLIESKHYGIVHLTNEGIASRFEFTAQILKGAGLGHIPLTPISLADYQRASTPPPYAPLANVIAGEALNIRLRPWQQALDAYFHATRDA